MKKDALRARAARIKAAQRLIQQQHVPPAMIAPKKPQEQTRRMVKPLELHIEVAKVATT